MITDVMTGMVAARAPTRENGWRFLCRYSELSLVVVKLPFTFYTRHVQHINVERLFIVVHRLFKMVTGPLF